MRKWEEIVSLDKYPIHKLTEKEGKELVLHCRQLLSTKGACELQNFLTPKALAAMVAESERLEKGAFRNPVVGNAYLTAQDPKLPKDDARNLTDTTVVGVVAYDEIPTDSLIAAVYEWDVLMHFIGAVLSIDPIYRYSDPMGALNLSVMVHGDKLRWHFDQTDFVTSIALQMPEEGGAFEYVPMIRSSDKENFEKVKAVLKGSREGVVTLPNKPGSLVLFKGRHSLHRVTEVKGKRTRILALLGYDSKADTKSSDYLRQIRYGRQAVKIRRAG